MPDAADDHRPTPSTSAPIVVGRGLSKRFEAVHALDAVDIELRGGEIHALMGENGAGKSTLIKCLTAVHRRDAGVVELAGRPVEPRSPREAEELGISCVHQEVHLIGHASIAENICLGREPTRRWLPWSIRWKAVRARAETALARLGLAIEVRRELSTCSIAVQQLVAIARALDVEAKLLVLDEPTSSLDDDEVRQLFEVLRRLRDGGLAILFVTHFLDQVYALADRITVLRDGRLVGTRPTADLPRRELVSLMVGRPVDLAAAEATRPGQGSGGEPILEARGLARRGGLAAVDLAVGPGQSLGLAGLLGSGRTETVRAIFGADPIDAGSMRFAGRAYRPRHPRDAMRLGIALLPESRKSDGILPNLSIRENILLAVEARRGVAKRLSRSQQDALAGRFLAALRIKAPHADVPIRELSGGNQQKALLARWLAIEPRLLLLDEPTRGIDVGAKEEVIRLVEDLRGRGLALVVVSSELEELVRLSGQVIVLRDRRSVATLAGESVTPQAMLAAIAAHESEDGRG